ncbi:MAG: transposase [Acetobacteraceae bacterium]|nr:transposase [Acetobacteraceae bacterium]
MPTSMTGNIDRVEVITSVQRRRRWPAEEKARIVQETSHEGCPVKSACCSFCSRKAYGLAKLRLRMLGQWTEVELRAVRAFARQPRIRPGLRPRP